MRSNPSSPRTSKVRQALRLTAAWLLICESLLLSGCSSDFRRFPNKAPRWEDADRNHVAHEPEEYFSGLIADAADKNFLKPLADLPYLPLGERAHNVNSLDEVPNSSWFQNRIGFYDISPERIARAACGDTPSLDPAQPLEVIAAKPNGAYPGFFIKVGEERYLLKFDSPVQPGRATSADVIGSKIYWAAGYHVPCNEIVYFRPQDLTIAEGATAEDEYGRKKPITDRDIHAVLEKAYRTRSGLLRASASRFLPGKPLGPFRYDSRRSDDPNDHVDHQHRRELRGNRVLASWLHHHDAREQNTLDVWLTNQGQNHDTNYIRHYMIDFGDCLGSRWTFDPVSARFGHSYLVDYDQFAVDLLTLGAYPRPWHHLTINPEAEIFGYFNVKDFHPAEWVTEYPNAAFEEMRYDDALWMTRIIARFTDAQMKAIVGTARLDNERAEQILLEILQGRRKKILKEYFTHYAPLDGFELIRQTPGDDAQSICFDDLAIKNGVVDPKRVLYKARFYGGLKLDREIGWIQLQPSLDDPGRTCITRPLEGVYGKIDVPKDVPDDDPRRYGLMKIWIHQQAQALSHFSNSLALLQPRQRSWSTTRRH